MIANIGQVRQRIKAKSDSTLQNMRKADLIEYIRCLEHNYNVAVSFNENQARYIESLGVTVQQWIPVTERMPIDFVSVLVHIPSDKPMQTVREAYHAGGIWIGRVWKYNDSDVTHWMPLPEPPKEVDK